MRFRSRLGASEVDEAPTGAGDVPLALVENGRKGIDTVVSFRLQPGFDPRLERAVRRRLLVPRVAFRLAPEASDDQARCRRRCRSAGEGAEGPEPWVDVARIVSETGIDLRTGDLVDVCGLLMRQCPRTIIGVNGEQAPVRQRFTIAHELGHYFLHDGLTSHRDTSFRVDYRDRTSTEAIDVEEIEANSFAACLLMPKPFLDRVDAAGAIGDDLAESDLARRFHVSGHAMSLRLVNECGRFRPF